MVWFALWVYVSCLLLMVCSVGFGVWLLLRFLCFGMLLVWLSVLLWLVWYLIPTCGFYLFRFVGCLWYCLCLGLVCDCLDWLLYDCLLLIWLWDCLLCIVIYLAWFAGLVCWLWFCFCFAFWFKCFLRFGVVCFVFWFLAMVVYCWFVCFYADLLAWLICVLSIVWCLVLMGCSVWCWIECLCYLVGCSGCVWIVCLCLLFFWYFGFGID